MEAVEFIGIENYQNSGAETLLQRFAAQIPTSYAS